MRLSRSLFAIVVLCAVSLSAQAPKAATLEEVIARYHEMHSQGVKLELPPTPNDFNAAAAKTFNVTARQFQFDFSPSPFVVNQGDSVTLKLTATDNGSGAGHGFFLERYAENFLTLPKNQTLTINFVASEPGTFFFFCTVSCGEGHTSMGGNFVVTAVAPAPTITSFTPTSGSTAGGNNVAITGTGFASGATVKFGDTAATAIINNATTITAIAPAHAAGPVPITVTNADGLSATSTQQYTYISAGPAIASVMPPSGSTSGGTTLTITGSGFQSGATVKIGGRDATNVTVSATSITATTPLGPNNVNAGGQAVAIVVTNPDATTATGMFTYTLPSPVLTTISPNLGVPSGGDRVTIKGDGFTTALPITLTFGGTAATGVLVVDPTTIEAIVPAHAAGTVNVVVSVGGSNAQATNGYTYATPPTKRRTTKP